MSYGKKSTQKFPVMCLYLKKEKDFTRAILYPELVKGKIREKINEIGNEKSTEKDHCDHH